MTPLAVGTVGEYIARGNWPPEYTASEAEAAVIARLLGARNRLAQIREQVAAEEQAVDAAVVKVSGLCARTWVAWHDDHGWPDGEPEYRAALRCRAGLPTDSRSLPAGKS